MRNVNSQTITSAGINHGALAINSKQPLINNRIFSRETILNALSTLAIWHAKHQQRLQLQQLDQHQLEDIGITQAEAMQEAAKPFWK